MAARALAALLLASVPRAAASCLGGSAAACAARGEADDRALLQLRQAGNASAAPDEASDRVLATVPIYPKFELHRVREDDEVSVKVRSIVPVFPANSDPYIAFVVEHRRRLWSLLSTKEADIACASDDMPGYLSPIKAYGGESEAKFQWTYVLKCAWPRELETRRCQHISLVDRRSGATLQSYKACHDTGLAKEGPFELAMCVRYVYEDPKQPEAAGNLLLPQWLEYNARRGVQQFVFYTPMATDARTEKVIRPYLQAGLMTQVRMEAPNDVDPEPHTNSGLLVMNDCVHRLRGRAKWLLPSHDIDEYLVFNETDRARAMPFRDALREVLEGEAEGETVHAVSFGRINFMHPARPFERLQVSSVSRYPWIARLCPKFFVRPDLVNALFTHWPTSWVEGTRNLFVQMPRLVAFHYRDNEIPHENSTEDRTLVSEAHALDAALQRRYGERWATFGPRMRPPLTAVTMAAERSAALGSATGAAADSVDGATLAGAETESDEAVALSSGARALAELVAGLREPTFIEGYIAHLT